MWHVAVSAKIFGVPNPDEVNHLASHHLNHDASVNSVRNNQNS
jgi:hypothetical protein